MCCLSDQCDVEKYYKLQVLSKKSIFIKFNWYTSTNKGQTNDYRLNTKNQTHCGNGAHLLTLCLLVHVPSDGTLCEQFGSPKRRARSGSKLFDSLMVFLKEFFEKVEL